MSSQIISNSECDCSVCVHGHDLDPRKNSMVVCGPQRKAHDAAYCCTGFRRITIVEIDEKADARFGKPNADLSGGIPYAPNTCSQSDTDRLVWLRRNISGLEMRRIGICMNDSSDTDEFRQRIDKAITATSRNTPPNIANVLAAQKATDNSTLRFGPEKQKGGERGGL